MKKYLIALALCLSSAMASAQVSFGYGFKAGLNFTTFDSDVDDVQVRPGQYGVLCRLKFGDSFAIQPELFYARQGIRSLEFLIDKHGETRPFQSENSRWNDYEKFRLGLLSDNVQLPIMFKYYLPFGQRFLNIQAGPQFSQRFDYRVSTPSPHGLLKSDRLGNLASKYDFGRDMNYFTILANVGIGYDSASGIGVDLRWSIGLTPVFRNIYPTAHDRIYSISFTYLL